MYEMRLNYLKWVSSRKECFKYNNQNVLKADSIIKQISTTNMIAIQNHVWQKFNWFTKLNECSWDRHLNWIFCSEACNWKIV